MNVMNQKKKCNKENTFMVNDEACCGKGVGNPT